jgi:hypothetical protein
MPAPAESKRAAILGILDRGVSLVRQSGSHMVGKTMGARSRLITVDSSLERNPSAGLSIRASGRLESALKTAFVWYIEGRRSSDDEF